MSLCEVGMIRVRVEIIGEPLWMWHWTGLHNSWSLLLLCQMNNMNYEISHCEESSVRVFVFLEAKIRLIISWNPAISVSTSKWAEFRQNVDGNDNRTRCCELVTYWQKDASSPLNGNKVRRFSKWRRRALLYLARLPPASGGGGGGGREKF